MKTRKALLAIIIQLSLSTMALAGDVEIHLPTASDAMTVDQPAGTELMRVNGDGSVGVGTTTPSDGTANGGQVLKLDIEGAVGATHFCDENGENCQTAASLAAGNAGAAMAFKVTSADTTTVRVRNTDSKMDVEWDSAPEINTFSNSTFANGTFTVGAGEGGLYEIFARVNLLGDEGRDRTSIYVNGAIIGLSSISTGTNTSLSSSAYGLVNLAEGDTVEVYSNYDHSTANQPLNCVAGGCYFTLQKIGAAATGGGADNLGSHTATKDIDLAASKLVGNGGTEGIAIDAGGNVGIGALIPSDGTANGGQALKLDVEGAVGATHFCDAAGENCIEAANLGTGGGTQKEYLDTHIVINYINNTGAVTVTEPNFDLSTLTTVPAWATHAIVMGRTLVAQSGGFTGGSSSSSIKLSHNGVNFNNLSIAAAYGGSGKADRSDDSNTQEVRIRDGKLIGFISATSDGGNTGQSTQAMLHLIGFAGYQ